jgi:cobalt/nickel transport system permease protein
MRARNAVDAALPLAVFPIVMLARSGLPASFVARRLVVLAPFALLVGAFNPIFDTATALRIGGIGISGGWLSFASILLRFMLTISALIVLVATTGVPALARAAEKLGAPRAFVVQLLSLYRYLFLTAGEVQRTWLAWRLRAPDGKRPPARIFAQMLGQLLLRSLARARRVHTAMLLRGFDGEVRMLSPLAFTARDWVFLLAWLMAFAVLRFAHPAELLGALLMRTA